MVNEILRRLLSFAVVRQSRFLSSTLFCLSATVYLSRSYTSKTSSTLLPKIITRYSTSLMSSKSSPMKSEVDSPVKVLLHEKDGSIFERDSIGTKGPASANGLKIICWNVAGLRGTLKKNPEVLNDLVDKQQPDLLCLQETKLQNVGDFGSLLADKGYKGYWTFSEVKKGYAGTVIFVRERYNPDRPPESAETAAAVTTAPSESGPVKKKTKKQAKLSTFFDTKPSDTPADSASNAASETETAPKNIPEGTVMLQDVLYLLPDSRFNGEGRWTQIETPDFYFINTYVPNSGQNLERLDYRCDEWDPYIREYLNKLREKKPVIYSGDLNVAHTDLDVYNFQAKHLLKQAGTTLREKESFSRLLDSGFKDALRHIYPAASGQFTYWSQRTRARPFNKGLRLDYFVCSNEMFHDREKEGEGDSEVEIINEGNSSSSSPAKEIETGVSDQVAEELEKPKVKASRKRATPPSPSPVENTKSEAEETVKSSSKIYPNPTNVKVLDSYILPYENDCSDHCPIVLIVERNV